MKNKFGIINNLIYIIDNIRRWDGKIVAFFGIYIFTIGFSPIINILFSKVIINQVAQKSGWNLIVQTILLISGLLLLVELLKEYALTVFDSKITYIRFKFLAKFYKRVMQIDYDKLELPDTLDKVEQLCFFMGSTQKGMAVYLRECLECAADILFMTVFIAFLISLKKWVILVIVLCGMMSFLIHRKQYFFEYSKELEFAGIRRKQQYYEHVFSKDSYGKDIRVFGMKNWLTGLMKQNVNRYSVVVNQIIRKNCLANSFNTVFLCIREAIVYGYLIYEVLAGHILVGDFAFYLLLMMQYASTIIRFAGNCAEISCEDKKLLLFRQFLDTKEADESGKADKVNDFHLIFENVSFKYPGTDKEVLKNISFEIQKGERIGIVGENGSGKTTLIKLICGFYKPVSGRILINGVPIQDIKKDALNAYISAVFQDINILDFTIEENVAMKSERNVDNERCDRALEHSELIKKVSDLKNGKKTFIGKSIDEEGIYLSGGESQRIVISRGDYKDASLIMMDEPTSALDPIAEKEMYERYNNMTSGGTSIYISHRLSSTKFCDKIIVLKDGCICELGTHDELMNINGVYAELYKIQSQYYGGK